MADVKLVLTPQSYREIKKMGSDIRNLKNIVSRLGVSGPRKGQQAYATILSSIGDGSYQAEEAIFGGSGADDWTTKDGGRTWGEDATDVGILFAIDSTLGTYEGTHPVFRFSDGTQTNWGFIPVGAGTDETVSFKHYIDGTDLRFYDGKVRFNSNVDDEVTDGGGLEAQDGYYYVQWSIAAGSDGQSTTSTVQYNASEPSFWTDDGGGNLTVKWLLGQYDSGIFITAWENDINAPGTGMPEYDDMAAGSDPSQAVYAGVADSSEVSTRTDHEHFLNIVDSTDKFVHGSLISHAEDGTKRIGGITTSNTNTYVSDIDTSTDDQVSFQLDQRQFVHKMGLVQDDTASVNQSVVTLKAEEWLSIEGGTWIHNTSPVDSTSHDDHWFNLAWDGTDFMMDGTVLDEWSFSVDRVGHIWDKNGEAPPPPDVNFRYTPCAGGGGTGNIVLDTSHAAVLEGGECWEFDATTAVAPTSTASATYADCASCLGDATNDLWKDCDTDESVGVMSPGHVIVDYAWPCKDSVRVKGYNAEKTNLAATDPDVLEPCQSIAPSSCNDLVGWPGSDDIGTGSCNTGSVSDTHWSIRYYNEVNIGAFSVVGTNLRGSSQSVFQMYCNVDPSGVGDYEFEVSYNVTAGSTGAYFAWQTPGMLVQFENDQWWNWDVGGSTTNFETWDNKYFSGKIKMVRSGNTGTIYHDGVQIATATVAGAGALTWPFWYFFRGSSGNTCTIDVAYYSIKDGSGNQIYIDPTGDSC